MAAELAIANPMASPIQRMPNEILDCIFDFAKPRWTRYWLWEFECQVMNSPTEKYNFNLDFEDPRGLPRAYNNLAHVCRHWRAVALGMASLWTTPDLRFPTLTQQMIKRTKAAKLNIVYPFEMFNCPSTARKRALSEALDYLSRIGNLVLFTNLEPLIPALSQAAPCLESLALASAETFVSLPSNFLGRHAPLLTNLSLHNCFLPRDSPVLESLASLRVHCGRSSMGKFTPRELLGLLQRCVRLQELELNDVFPIKIECGTLAVNLPCLRHLKLVSEGNSTAFILNHIKHPVETRVSLWSRSIQTHDHLDQICSTLRQKFVDSSPVAIQTLAKTAFLAGALGRFTIELWESPIRAVPPKFGTGIHRGTGCSFPDPLLRLDFLWDRGFRFDDVAKRILDTLLPTEVETVLVDTLTIGLMTFASTFSSMEKLFSSPKLRTAAFRGDCIRMLSPMLTSTHQPLFPSLNTLHLTSTSLSVGDGLRLVESLYRHRTKAKLEKLVVRNCRGFKEGIESLNKFVEEVDCDSGNTSPWEIVDELEW